MSTGGLVACFTSGATLSAVNPKARDRSGKLTPENLEESRKLKELWDKSTHGLTQEQFGAKFEIGNQGMVWQCLNGTGAAISLKAARGFARGLGVQIAQFSPRLATEAGVNAQFAATWPFPDIDRSRFDSLKESQRFEIQGLVRERLEKFEAANQEPRSLGAPVAPEHLEAVQRLSEDAEAREAQRHAKKQRRRAAA